MTVEAVAPDVWSVRIPMPTALDHVYAYVLETPAGPVLVDAGPGGAQATRLLARALDAVGHALGDVHGVLATHAHADHYGGAGDVRDASGAWIALHPDDAELATAGRLRPDEVAAREQRWLARLGAPPAARTSIVEASLAWHGGASCAEPDLRLRHGQAAPVPGWELTVLHTPGHTRGHVCLLDRGRRLLFAGDHVLPTISPSIGLYYVDSGNPLREYLDSLRSVGDLANVLVLPGHGPPITALPPRLVELLAHHEDRLEETERIVAGRVASVWEVARRMPWSRPWARIDGLMRSAALAEAHAHLIELEERGVVERVPIDRPVSYASRGLLSRRPAVYTD